MAFKRLHLPKVEMPEVGWYSIWERKLNDVFKQDERSEEIKEEKTHEKTQNN